MTDWQRELNKAYQRGFEDNTKLTQYASGFITGIIIYMIISWSIAWIGNYF
ncbi:hypothetical protein [Leptospira johnsonii]|uniref:Uncharacterized protein n=1 Tax=Leptospira johnsonii TaxID=1917820 RepID=A0A2P2D7N6_9LEPT|nr:hypothetical protein [Leptospira johnsonii]GBF40647.1 hypothetical protein LPTSP1_36650 [Leptospira johnsonii]